MNSTNIINNIDALRQFINTEIDKKIASLPISLPCKVVKRNKVLVSVTTCIKFGDLQEQRIEDVPIIKSPYLNEPVKVGDFGILVPVSFFYQSIVTDNKSLLNDTIPSGRMNNFYFLPLTQEGTEPTDGTETVLSSKGLTGTVKVKDDAIELYGNDGFVTEFTALKTKVDTFITSLNTHTHNVTAPGSPSGPPVPTMTLDITTAKVSTVKVKKDTP